MLEPDVSQNQVDPRNGLAEMRTKLAAERTFLAWLRTGMTSVGIGIALARFIIFKQEINQKMSHWLGELLILLGVAIFIFALVSYKRGMSRFQLSSSDAPFMGLLVFTVVLVVISLILFGIILE